MRWKLIAGNVLALVIVGLVAWLVVRGRVSEALVRDVDDNVRRGAGLLDAVRTAESERFKSTVAEGTQRPDIQALFALTSASEQTTAAFNAAQTYAREFAGSPGADLVALVNAEGRVLARNVDVNQDRNRDLRGQYEVVDVAIRTRRPARDLLKYDEQKWYDVVVAPVVAGEELKGLLLVGYEIGDSVAHADQNRLGAGVGYLVRDGDRFIVPALSIGTQAEKDALAAWANGASGRVTAIFNTDQTSPAQELTLSGDAHLAAFRALPGVIRPSRAGATRHGFVVLTNVSDTRAPATPATLPILLMTLLGLALVAGYNVVIANYFEQPIEQIEEGLLRIINGDRDHRIEVQHAELGGMVYRINQLVSELTGAEEETDESGRISSAPQHKAAPTPQETGPAIDETSIGSFNPSANPVDAELAQQLSTESENDYYERLRKEYQQCRARAGQGADAMSHEQFVEMVRANEQLLAQKYALTLVRFQVQTQGNQVIFRAIPIR